MGLKPTHNGSDLILIGLSVKTLSLQTLSPEMLGAGPSMCESGKHELAPDRVLRALP